MDDILMLLFASTTTKLIVLVELKFIYSLNITAFCTISVKAFNVRIKTAKLRFYKMLPIFVSN